jgi:hypothetical protein
VVTSEQKGGREEEKQILFDLHLDLDLDLPIDETQPVGMLRSTSHSEGPTNGLGYSGWLVLILRSLAAS